MSKCKCLKCKAVFDEEELDHYDENIGEFWGAPAYQSFPICPECGSDDYDDAAVECEGCGGWFTRDEMVGDYFCRECFDKKMGDINFVLAAAEETEFKSKITISNVIIDLLGEAEIEYILRKEVLKYAAEKRGLVDWDGIDEDAYSDMISEYEYKMRRKAEKKAEKEKTA